MVKIKSPMSEEELPNRTLLKVKEVALFFGVSPQTVYRWVDMRQLMACNLGGGSLRIFRESVIHLMKERVKW